MSNKIIGDGAHSGPWELVDDTNEDTRIRSFTGQVNLWDSDYTYYPAYAPSKQCGEDEYDFNFTFAEQVSWIGHLTNLHCEITNDALHKEWKAEFDWRFRAAKKVCAKGWCVIDGYHYDTENLNSIDTVELHPLRELRFSVPSEHNVEYRCLFMDMSNRFYPVVFEPWPSKRPVITEKRHSFLSYHEKCLTHDGADYGVAWIANDLFSTAQMSTKEARVIVQSNLTDCSNKDAFRIKYLGVTPVLHQNVMKFRRRYQLELIYSLFPQEQITWELSSSAPNTVSYEYTPMGNSEQALIDIYVSSQNILNHEVPFQIDVFMKAYAVITGSNRTLPVVKPFDESISQGPAEYVFRQAHTTLISPPQPFITLMPTTKIPIWHFDPKNTGIKTFVGSGFKVWCHDFAIEPQLKDITWEVRSDQQAILLKLEGTDQIHVDYMPAEDEDVTVIVKVVDAIGTVFEEKYPLRWDEFTKGVVPDLLYDIGQIDPLVGPGPVSHNKMLRYGTPLSPAAARAHQSLYTGQEIAATHQAVSSELNNLADLAEQQQLSTVQWDNLRAFFAIPGRTDARLSIPARLRKLAQVLAQSGTRSRRTSDSERPMVTDPGKKGIDMGRGEKDELEPYDLIDERQPVRSLTGALLSMPKLVPPEQLDSQKWTLRVRLANQAHELFAGHGAEQDFPGIECRITNPVLSSLGDQLRTFLARAADIQVEGYWMYNRSGCNGYKIELNPVTRLQFTADDSLIQCWFASASDSFGDSATHVQRDTYQVPALCNTSEGQVHVYHERVLAANNCTGNKEITPEGLQSEVQLNSHDAYLVLQSEVHRIGMLDVTVDRVTAERDAAGNGFLRYSVSARFVPWAEDSVQQLFSNWQWSIQKEGEEERLTLAVVPGARNIQFTLDVSATVLSQHDVVRWDLELFATSPQEGLPLIVPAHPSSVADNVPILPNELTVLRGTRPIYLFTPRIALNSNYIETHSPEVSGHPDIMCANLFELEFHHFPILPSIVWEAASDDANFEVATNEQGMLQLVQTPEDSSDVRITAIVTDLTGVEYRRVFWAREYGLMEVKCAPIPMVSHLEELLPPSRQGTTSLEKVVLRQQLQWRDESWFLPNGEKLDLAPLTLRKLVKVVSRSADHGNFELGAAGLAELSNRLRILAGQARNGALDHQGQATLQDLCNWLLGGDSRSMVLRLSRLGVAPVFRRALADIHGASPAEVVEALSAACKQMSAMIADPARPHFHKVRQIEVR